MFFHRANTDHECSRYPLVCGPSAISPRTSRSRAVSAVSGSRRRANICRTTCSSSTVPPAAIRVTASRSSSRDEIRSFSKYPTPESPAAGDRSDAPGASPRVVEQRQRDMWSYVDPSARPVARPEGLHLNLCGGYPSLIFPAATRKCGLKLSKQFKTRAENSRQRTVVRGTIITTSRDLMVRSLDCDQAVKNRLDGRNRLTYR
jgi:hypothetical protein